MTGSEDDLKTAHIFPYSLGAGGPEESVSINIMNNLVFCLDNRLEYAAVGSSANAQCIALGKARYLGLPEMLFAFGRLCNASNLPPHTSTR